MSELEKNNMISIETIQFPHHLLVPSLKNILKLRITNNSDKEEKVKLDISGERVEIKKLNTEKSEISIPPNQNKIIELQIIPKVDGFGVVSINAEWLKIVQFTVKVQKVREKVPSNKLDNIWKKYEPSPRFQKEDFDPNEFIQELSKGEIKKLNKNICNIEDELEETPSQEAIKITDLTNELRECLKSLVKAYMYNKEFDNALSTIKKFPNEDNKKKYLKNIIRTYFFIDFENMANAIDLIDDVEDKRTLMKTIVIDLIKEKPQNALKLLEKLRNEREFYTNSLFQIAQLFLENNKVEKIESILMKLYYLAKNGENKIYNLLKDVIYSIAEIFSPEKAEKLITSMDNQQLKEQIARDLFDDIYVMVDEHREKIEPQLINDFRYHVNICTNDAKNFTEFAKMGGNVSANILAEQFDFDVLLVSLFAQEFSLFPTLDRLYSDITYNEDKSIGYVLFPSKNSLNDEEKSIISDVFKTLITNRAHSTQFKVYIIDFIPYLGKPTLIIGTEQMRGERLKQKLHNFTDSINITIDNNLFEGGKTAAYLMKIFNRQIVQTINLVFSYEFINQYQIFKDVFITLI